MNPIKNCLIAFGFSLVSAYGVANPCTDFIDEDNEPHKVYFAPEPGFCIIDHMLANKTQFIERKIVYTKSYGPVEFLRSSNGNVAMVGNVLAMAGIIENDAEIKPKFIAIISAIISSFANPIYRNRMIDAGKWAGASIGGNALWEGVKWTWNKIFD